MALHPSIAFLHSHNALHRDLKPENILEDDHLFPKITDFKLYKIIHENADSMTTQSLALFFGTPLCMAPELFDLDSESSKPVDFYTFSFTMYEILNMIILIILSIFHVVHFQFIINL